MNAGVDLGPIDRLTGGKLGTHDVPCPLCAPYHSTQGQRRRVLRIWRVEPGFATFCCARCGETGYVHDRDAAAPGPAKLTRLRAEAAEHDRVHKIERLSTAGWLWAQRRPIECPIAERYLRERRKITCPLPSTLGFLPARDGYAPANLAEPSQPPPNPSDRASSTSSRTFLAGKSLFNVKIFA